MLAIAKLFFKNNKKILIWISTFLVLFFIDFDVSFAIDTDNEELIEKANFIIGLLNIVMKIVSAIMSVMTAFVSLFLQPTWVNGTFINLDLYLKEIWRLVANTVYVIFAFLLIIIAFANIIGKGQDKFALKQALPKFIVWVLIVPASWFIVQFMISISWILTVSALTLPFDTFQNSNPQTFWAFSKTEENGRQPLLESKICVKYVINLWEVANGEEAIQCKDDVVGDDGNATTPDEDARVTVSEILFWAPWNQADNGQSIYSIIGLYTYGIIGIEELDNLDWTQIASGSVTGIFAFLWKIVFSLVFVVVYFVLLIALFFALFVRILRIWIFMMLSPLFGLMYFFWKGVDKFSFKEFFALIMTPVYVGLALSFWFLFMMVASHWLKNISWTTDTSENTPLQLWLFEVDIQWSINESWLSLVDGQGEEKTNDILKSFKWLGWALWEMIVMIFGIGMFWIAVMAALKQSEITKAVIQPIEQFWNQVWKLAASAPMYAPIIPTGKGMTSAAGVWNLASRWFAEASNYRVKEGQKLWEKFGFLDGTWTTAISTASQQAKNNIKSYNSESQEFTDEIKKATFIDWATLDTLSSNNDYLELMNKALEKIWNEFRPSKGNKSDIAEALRIIDDHNEKVWWKGVFSDIESKWRTRLDNNEVERSIQEWIANRKSWNQTNDSETTRAISGIRLDTFNTIELKADGNLKTIDEANIWSTEKQVLTQLETAIKELSDEERTENKVRDMLLENRDFTNTEAMDAVIKYFMDKNIILNNPNSSDS